MANRGYTLSSRDPVMRENDYLESPGQGCRLVIQPDSNLVIYRRDGQPVWDIGTGGPAPSPHFLMMKDNGELVVCAGTGPSDNRGQVWSSASVLGLDNYFACIEDDGNLVIKRGTGADNQRGAVWDRMYDDAIRASLEWVWNQGPATRDGEDGKGYVVWWDVRSNPEPAAPTRSGSVRREQKESGWYISVSRGETSGRDCVRNARADLFEGFHDHALGWLCAGQAHSPDERRLYRRSPSHTLSVLSRYFGRRA
jgi:hypothetical protein